MTDHDNQMTNQQDKHQRAILPIPDRPYTGLITYDAKDPDTHFPPIEPIRPPEDAPNVLVVLIDDVGFSASSAFGGPCETPNFERLANGGLRYNRFHTTALCAPTRAAMLTGRNHHSVGMGGVTEIATSAPGNDSVRPNTKAPLAQTLQLNGYSTSQFGKCHEVPVWQSSPMGPFDMWPTGSGFEYFYGFIGGEDSQWYLNRSTRARRRSSRPRARRRLPPHRGPRRPRCQLGAHAEGTDARQAVLHVLRARRDTRPAACPKSGSRSTRATSSTAGTNSVSAPSPSRAVIPPDADLTVRHEEIPAWDDMPDELKPILEREMEIYAGFLSHTDHHVGRLLDAIEELGIMDETMIYVIIGDNGASAEGTLNGSFNEMISMNGMAALETPEFLAAQLEKFGGPEAYNHYAVGWAHAMNTPFQWTKQVASHWGGTRTGTIVHWPRGIEAKGELRQQFHHVIDVAPTPCSRRPASPSRRWSTGSRRAPTRERACSTASRPPKRPSATTCSTSRLSATAASTSRAGAP